MEHDLKPLHGIYLLLEKVYPKSHKSDLETIIQLNQGGMKSYLEKFINNEFFELTEERALEKLNESDKEWQKPSTANLKRKNFLTKLFTFSKPEHMEMLNLEKIRELIPIKRIKLALSRTSFINFSIKEKMKNLQLSIQGLYLQIFLNYHMKHDLRFKAKVDSMQIEMDNPYARQQIRDENRKDEVIGKRYLEDMEVDEWCKHLLENLFPNIAGIWADHVHITHVSVLAIVRFCYECGFIDIEDSEEIIKLLYRVCTSLLKLEEAWIEKLAHIRKISDTMRANNVTKHFAKCREHIAAILVQMITLYQDNYFIKQFPLEGKKADDEEMKNFMKDMELGNYPFFNESQNNIILFITMNYLSLTVEIESQKGTNSETKRAVEKIFLYITSENKDCFIESIKQVTADDLKYFTKTDVISGEYRDVSDSMGYSMRTLLEFIGMGCFDRDSLKMIKNIENHKNYNKYLSSYVSKDATLKTIIAKMAESLKGDMSDIDFRVALAKESIPLMLLALADYITEYFTLSKDTKELVKDIFDILYEISVDNNNCKGQIFKGDGLFHLSKLIKRQNKYAFFFLNKLCETSSNIAIFLGRGFFVEIVDVYKEFQKRVIEDIEIASDDMDGDNAKKLNEEIDVDDWALYIILNKLFTKLMNKKFINEREKIQSSLQIQEAIYPSLTSTLLKNFIRFLKTQKERSKQKESLRLKKDIFRDGEEDRMVSTLEKREHEGSLTYVDLSIIGYQLCFSSLKAFNTACSNVFSNEVYESVLPFTDELKDYLFLSGLEDKKDTDPFGLDTEIIKLLRNMTLIPESNIMIERNFDMNHEDNQVFDADSTALDDIRKYLRRCVDYSKQLDLREEGQKFVMEGVLPFIYKYVTSLLNLTHFEIKQKGLNPYITNKEKKDIDVNDVKYNLKIAMQVYDAYKENNQALINLMDRNITNTLFSNSGDDHTELFEDKPAKKKPVSNDKLLKYTNRLITFCKKVIKDIEKFYSGSKYAKDLEQFKQMDKEEFINNNSKARFQGETKDPNIQKKMDRLNFFIKGYKEAKNEYLERAEGPNLIGFFDKNTDNLFGVFASCIDRVYGKTKIERWNTEKMLAKDTGINRFWMNQSCYAYIKMLEKLISSSKTAREEFFNFITENNSEEAEDDFDVEMPEESMENVEKNELMAGVGMKVKIKEGGRKSQTLTKKSDREKLIGMLQRIQHDLVLFLTTSPTQKPIWWNVNMIFEMLCSFFKNLCENNYIEFKDYLGEYIPLTEDEKWNFEHKTCTEIFTDQLQYLLASSKLAENRENYMVHSDQEKRIQPLLQPLMNVLNELVTGPCKTNQKIVTSQPIIEIFQLMSRLIDQLDDDYIELKHSALILVLSLSEGFDPEIIEEISVRATPSILLNQIHRTMKKIYVSELIRQKKFKSEVMVRNKEQARKILERKKKKGKIANETGGKGNKVNPDPGLKKATTFGDEIKSKSFNENFVNQKMENSVMIRKWNQLKTLYLNRPQFSEGLLFDFAFRMVILWQLLTKFSKRHNSRLKEIRDEAKECFEEGKEENSSEYQKEISSIFYFIDSIMLNVEVVDPNQNHLLVYFPRQPDCFLLAEEDKKNYVENCDISDSNTKMLDLMRNFNLFSIQMEENIKSYRTMPLLYELTSKDAFAFYNKIAWTIGFLINAFIGYSVVRKGHEKLASDSDTDELIYQAMSWIMIGFCAFCLVVWFIFRYGQKTKIKREEFMFDHPHDNPDTIKNKWNVKVQMSIFQSSVAMSMIFYLIFTLYGLLKPSYTIMTFNLFLFVNISRNAKFILKSITLHAGPLLLALLMALFVIFTYSIVLAEFYYGTLDIENLEEMDICSNMYTCFWYTMNWGLRNGGGIADSMTVEPKGSTFFAKNLYDVSFFIVVNVIALNIIFGMIIDTFSALREEEGERRKILKIFYFSL